MYTKYLNHAHRMENDKLHELEQRLFELEKAFDKSLIDFETYIRQRSLLVYKKEVLLSKPKIKTK